MALEGRVPGQTVAFLLVASQPQLWLTLTAGIWPAGVLAVVEHQHVGARSLGGDEEEVLRHVPGSVDLTLVIHLDVNLYLAHHAAVASQLSFTVGCRNHDN